MQIRKIQVLNEKQLKWLEVEKIKSPWSRVNSSSTNQETGMLWNPKILFYQANKSLLLDPIHNQTNPVHSLTPYFIKDPSQYEKNNCI